MRFLVDNPLSPVVARGLRTLGHDALHVRDIGLASESDTVILRRARLEGRIVVSADTDFGTILARTRGKHPSVVLFRHGTERRPEVQVRILGEVLPGIEDALAAGAVVALEPTRVRVRRLPIGGNRP